jgi:hypothetical protein
MQVVVVRCTEAEVAEFQLCTIATHFMANRIVLPFVDAEEQPEEQQTQMKSMLGTLLPVQMLSCYLNVPCFFHPCALHFKSRMRGGIVSIVWEGGKHVVIRDASCCIRIYTVCIRHTYVYAVCHEML